MVASFSAAKELVRNCKRALKDDDDVFSSDIAYRVIYLCCGVQLLTVWLHFLSRPTILGYQRS